MKMNGTSKAVSKLLLDWWALFAEFSLKNWRTNTKKLQNGYPRPYPCIPLLTIDFMHHNNFPVGDVAGHVDLSDGVDGLQLKELDEVVE